jgi:hypothetical protein
MIARAWCHCRMLALPWYFVFRVGVLLFGFCCLTAGLRMSWRLERRTSLSSPLHATTPWTTARLRSRVTSESVEVGAAQRFQVGGDRCETTVAEVGRGRRLGRRPLFSFLLSARKVQPSEKTWYSSCW